MQMRMPREKVHKTPVFLVGNVGTTNLPVLFLPVYIYILSLFLSLSSPFTRMKYDAEHVSTVDGRTLTFPR